MHQTQNLDDGYMGSGKLIKQAIKKFGIENFKKEILYILSNKEEMENKEKELVTWSEVNEHLCYNMTIGGTGGPIWLGKNHSDKSKKLMSERASGRVFSEEHKLKLSEAAKVRKSNRLGSIHSQESIEKIKSARSKQTKIVGGLKNKIWINDGAHEKAHTHDEPIPLGWNPGRIFRKRRK
jgi:group I intron endonuclease